MDLLLPLLAWHAEAGQGKRRDADDDEAVKDAGRLMFERLRALFLFADDHGCLSLARCEESMKLCRLFVNASSHAGPPLCQPNQHARPCK